MWFILLLIGVVTTFDYVNGQTAFNLEFAKQLANYNVVVGCEAKQIIKWNCYPCMFVPKLTDVTVLKGGSGDSAGYVGYSPDYQATILVYRGTRSLTNVFVDLALKYKKYQRCGAGFKCKVHSGFYHSYLEIQSAVHQQIANRTIRYGNKIIVTGLSLGGAMAIHSSAHLMSLGYNISQLYTFGCPRVGNKQFHRWFRLKYGNRLIARIVHYNDPVPHLPAGKGYYHIGTEIFLNRDSSSYQVCTWQTQDRNCSKKVCLIATNVSMHTRYWNTSVLQMVKKCN